MPTDLTTFTVTLAHTTYEVVQVLAPNADAAREIALERHDDNSCAIAVDDADGNQVWSE